MFTRNKCPVDQHWSRAIAGGALGPPLWRTLVKTCCDRQSTVLAGNKQMADQIDRQLVVQQEQARGWG